MHSENPPQLEKEMTAAELRKLSRDQREAILSQQASMAEAEYQTNPELIDFEAFGKDDLYGESTGTQTG